MLTLSAGQPFVELMTLAYQANQPVLLHGKHGVGKSELLVWAAAHLGIDLIVRDLSLMEPPDLIGIPRIDADGKTHYAPPAFLPLTGAGLVVFEELNRCPRYMQGPCLQLLTARQLNDYTLPPGWLPCAAINDAADGYLTDELDAALLSRFLQVEVVPDVAAWVQWAQTPPCLHPAIITFVDSSPGIFEDPAANPRAWTYASRLLTAWEAGSRHEPILTTALAGVLGDTWAAAFLQCYRDTRSPLKPKEIVDSYPAHRAALRTWVQQGCLDVVKASLERLTHHLQPQTTYERVLRESGQKANVEAFFADLPGDLQHQVSEWLAERGFTGLTVAAGLHGGAR